MSIEKIILTIDKKFKDENVFFDLGIWNTPDGTLLYKIWVSNRDVYFSKRYKNITKLLHKKYPNTKFYSYYCSKNKSDEVD